MSLTLLAPVALGLLVLGLGPVLAHLARQRPARTQDYGAMLLLRRLSRRQRRRRRVQDLLLLLLRVAAVLLAVLAVSRPELRWPGPPPDVGGSGTVVVVVDNSLSMDLREGLLARATPDAATGTLLSNARQQAIALVDALPEGTLVGAVSIGGEARRITPSLTRDTASVATALQDLRQTQGGTDLAGGLREARRLLAGGGGEVIVFTDEAGPVAVPSAAAEIGLLSAQGGALIPRAVRADDPRNLAVVDAHYGDGPEGGSVRVKVANYGRQEAEAPITVRLPDGVEINAFIEVPPGESAEESVTVPRVAAGGVGAAEVRDSALSADDAFSFHLPRVGASRVLVVDGDPGPTPLASEVYFLERALAPWGATAAARGGVLPDVTSIAGIHRLDPDLHRVVFLANIADPTPIAGRLLDFVRGGGGLVISVGSNTTADLYNAALKGLLPAPLRASRALVAPGEPGRRVVPPDTSLELFRPFARGGRAAFAKVSVQRVFTTEAYKDDAEVQTLLRVEGGVPLLIERRVGRGRVLLLTTTMDRGWTDLPLQAVYMPLVQRITRYLGADAGGSGSRVSARVGDTVNVPLPDSALDVSVEGPAGPVPGRVRNGVLSFRAEQAGAYVVETPGAPPLAWVAANVDPVESDVRPGPSLIETAARVDPERFLRRRSLSPWLLGLALLAGLLQAVLAGPRQDEAEEAKDDAGASESGVRRAS